MIRRVFAIAKNTFREAIRNRVLYGVLFVVAAVDLFAVILGEMSLHEEARVARDFGLGGISLCGSLTAIALGVSLLYAEVQRRTIHVVLSKPIRRGEFVLGKYLGMAATLLVLVALFSGGLALLLDARDVPVGGAVVRGVVLAALEILVVAAVAVFFSSFTSPFLAGVFSLALFFLGRVSDEIRYAAQRASVEALRVVARAALRLVPDLGLFAASGGEVEGRAVSVHGSFVSWGYVGGAALYAALVISVLLTLAVVAFRRRDFT